MEKTTVNWEDPKMIYDQPTFDSVEKDARLFHPGTYGAEYSRMVILPNGNWLVVYTIYDNNGYLVEADGGTKLQFSVSEDAGNTWKVISTLAHPARDMDNGQMLVLKNGDILMACRSVRWQESYQLPVYRSSDNGKTWEFLSIIDEKNGAPGSLGNPDKGVYEPHLYYLENGDISVMYANEKHVTEIPSYSQIISQKISHDGGKTWGSEIWVAWDCNSPQLRPGMPVFLRMKDGRYIVVFEVVNLVLTMLESASIYYKISDDGIHWEAGIGTQIPEQSGGPYIEELNNGWLLVSSQSGKISISKDVGKTWEVLKLLPFPSHTWSSIYTLDENRFAFVNGCKREIGGNNVQICIGTIIKEDEKL